MRKLTSAILLSTCFILPVFADEQKPANPIIKMATTTSTQDSGLLNELLPAFQKKTGYEVQVTAVGTGKALKLGENGDVDVVLVHARADEDKFVAAGFGDQRYSVMYNDFIVVGPVEDPAKVQETKTTADALKQIAETKSPFVSRGDESGTHKMEKKLWEKASIKPEGEWYREAGQGMGEVLQMSGELKAYTLTDRGTWLATMDNSPLKIVLEGDKSLINPYGIIAVSQKRYPDVNHAGAQALIEWLVSVEGQKAIGDYKINGQALFTPSADAAEAKPANEPVKTN
ncbi:MAG: tungsten ABC transporter substrate-binding protein [Thiothrix sp.]|nr:MAG: tungsten ABC transporter substrate-binding protein [Thiothrix sp.]